MDSIQHTQDWLPVAFVLLMGLSILLYVILDGYDLGVGMLMSRADEAQKDRMIASIGPFWDANETWLVLSVGLLLVAFPAAHGLILSELYIPATLMLIALILRGVSFDFRAKAGSAWKHTWDRTFFAGSLLAALSQGYMLGLYIMGFDDSGAAQVFALLVAVAVAASYCLIGACWLVMKTEGELQVRAVCWARRCLWFTSVGIVLISLATPLVSERIFARWFSFPEILLLAPIPLLTALLVVILDRLLASMPQKNDRAYRWPFWLVTALFVLCFQGLAYSFYPYVVPEQMTIYQAAASPQSLMIIFVGALVVLPFIIGYTIFAYRVFRGKANELSYY